MCYETQLRRYFNLILKYQVLHETNKSCIIFNYAIRLKVKIHKKN